MSYPLPGNGFVPNIPSPEKEAVLEPVGVYEGPVTQQPGYNVPGVPVMSPGAF